MAWSLFIVILEGQNKTYAELYSEWIKDPECRSTYEIEERSNMSLEMVRSNPQIKHQRQLLKRLMDQAFCIAWKDRDNQPQHADTDS